MINKKIDYIGENIIIDEVNGLKVYLMPKKGFSKSFAQISVKYGSNDYKFAVNDDEYKEYPLGIAHFLEHKLFEQKHGNIFDKFTMLGSSPNAYTNYSETCYYFNTTNEFYENLKLLLDFVYNPYFTEENVEKEKGIIEQEIRMYEDNPGSKVYYNAVNCMYKSHPVKNDIAGTVQSIREINSEFLYECYNAFYVPDNMQLVIVGDINIEKVIKICSELVPKTAKEMKVNRFRFENTRGIVSKEKIEKMNLSIPNFIIGFKDDFIHSSTNIMERKIIGDILGRIILGRSSELYEKLYNSGIINESFEFDYTGEEEYAHFFIGGESRKPEMLKKVIIDYLQNIKDFDSDTVNRIKKAMTGAYIGRFNSIDSIGSCINDYYIRNIDLFNYLNILKEADTQKLKKSHKEIFSEDKAVLAVIE